MLQQPALHPAHLQAYQRDLRDILVQCLLAPWQPCGMHSPLL